MATFLKRAQLYLGLGPDEEYEEYGDSDYDDRSTARDARDAVAPPPPRPAPPRSATPRPAPPKPVDLDALDLAPPPPGRAAPRSAAPKPPPPRQAREATARPRPAPPPPAPPASDGSAVRTLPPKDRPMDALPPPPKPRPVVRQVAATPKPSVIAPKSFNHAQEVADRFKASQPVILNLQSTDRDLAKRLLDFCSGICYALGGNMEKVGTRVYLLTPSNVEISAEDRRRMQERGMYDS